MAHTETMLESKEIFNGRVIRVTVDKVQLEDGTTSTREIVHHHGGACILPVDADAIMGGVFYLLIRFSGPILMCLIIYWIVKNFRGR